MSALKVYASDGTVRAEINKYQYNGEFMGNRTVTATLNSPVAIHFAVGDYVTVRGQKFKIYSQPTVKKQARKGTYGAGYVYDNITFHSALQDLVVVKFKDYVLNDNKTHYSGLDTFSFYMTKINDLGDRILANINRVYGKDTWQILYASSDIMDNNGKVIVHGADEQLEVKAQSISISSGTSLHDALNLYNSTFDFDYIFLEMDGKHTVIIGGRPLIDSDDFAYGKGRGLVSLQVSRNDTDAVITRLHAYGSTRNLPYRYYNKFYNDKEKYPELFKDDGTYILDAMYINKLMLPYSITFKDGTVIKPWVVESEICDAYIDSDNKEKYGLREADITFDGSDDKWDEIYPSVEGMLLSYIKEGMTGYADGWTEEFPEDHEYSITNEQIEACKDYVYDKDTLRLDQITMGSDEGDDMILDNGVSADGTYEDGTLDTEGNEMYSDFYVRIPQLFFNPYDFVNSSETPTINVKTGMCAGRSFEILDCEEDITVPKVGKCAPKGYILHLKRDDSDVSSINMVFPNTTYIFSKGDEFVITGINMPGIYVETAEQRLYEQAIEYLSEYDHENYTYTPTIDNIFLSNNQDVASQFMEGMQLPFNDTDKDDIGTHGDIGIGRKTVAIKQLIVKYNEGSLPHYEVTLDDTIDSVSIQDIINSQIKHLAAGFTSTGNASTKLSKIEDDTAHGLIEFEQGFTVADTNKLDKNGNLEVENVKARSKLNVDGIATLNGTTRHFGNTNFGLYNKSISGGNVTPDGDAELKSLVLRENLIVPKITYNSQEWICGNNWRSQGGGVIKAVATTDDGSHYALLELSADEDGKVSVGDKCQGVFHLTGDGEGNNENADTDDHNGHFTFKGFKTIYFLITKVFDGSSTESEKETIYDAFGADDDESKKEIDNLLSMNGVIQFKTRSEVDSSWEDATLPQPQMDFAEYANATTSSRQWVTLTTSQYEICLSGMTDWTYGEKNIQYIRGYLEGFNITKRRWDSETQQWVEDGILALEGVGIAFGNAYMWGNLQQFNRAPSLISQQLYKRAMDVYTAPSREDIGTLVDKEATEALPYLWAYWKYIYSEGDPTYSDVFLAANYADTAYTVNILSVSGSTVIHNGQGSLSLKAYVYKGGEDITSTLPASAFSWKRNSNSGEYDEGWNERHTGVGSTITVNAEDVNQNAIFECEINN